MNYTKNTSKLTKSWDTIFRPLSLPFYSSKEFIHFHDVRTLKAYEANYENYLLRDGIIGILPLIQYCLNSKIKKEIKFNVASQLAPIIPESVRHNFLFYELNAVLPKPQIKKEILILFISAFHGFHHFELFKKQIDEIQSPITSIHFLKNPLQELTINNLTSKEYDLKNMVMIMDYIKTKFPNAFIKTYTAHYEIVKLNFHNAYFINTNHYFQFIGYDFLSYISFFKTSENQFNLTQNSNYKLLKSENIIRNLKINFLEYNGPSIFNSNHLNSLSYIHFPTISKTIIPIEFYNKEAILLSERIASDLFEFNKLNI
jgi:hypothetical protein